GKLAEPAVGEAGAIPRSGAGPHEGERPAAPPAGPKEVPITFLEDREVEDALEEIERQEGQGGEGEQEEEQGEKPAKETTPAQEGEQAGAGEGEAEGEQPAEPFAIPPVREGEQPIPVEVDDPELE